MYYEKKQGNIIEGKLSRFKDAINTLWVHNVVNDLHEFQIEEGSCFDPDSDMDAAELEEGYYGHSYSYNFQFDYDEYSEEGFFCGI